MSVIYCLNYYLAICLYLNLLCRPLNPPWVPIWQQKNWYLSRLNAHWSVGRQVLLAGRSLWTPCCSPQLLLLAPRADWSRSRTTAPRWTGPPDPRSRQAWWCTDQLTDVNSSIETDMFVRHSCKIGHYADFISWTPSYFWLQKCRILV